MTIITNRRRLFGRRARVASLGLFALAALLCQPERTAAQQWSTNGNNINNTNPGNVGVGTTNPANGKFEIVSDDGTASGEHSLIYASRSGTSSGGIKLGYRADGTTVTGGFLRGLNNSPFFIGTTAVPQALTLDNTGYLGIGTTAPLSFLDINGPPTASQPQMQIRNGTTTGRVRLWGDSAAGIEMWKDGAASKAAFIGMNKPGFALERRPGLQYDQRRRLGRADAATDRDRQLRHRHERTQQ